MGNPVHRAYNPNWLMMTKRMPSLILQNKYGKSFLSIIPYWNGLILTFITHAGRKWGQISEPTPKALRWSRPSRKMYKRRHVGH